MGQHQKRTPLAGLGSDEARPCALWPAGPCGVACCCRHTARFCFRRDTVGVKRCRRGPTHGASLAISRTLEFGLFAVCYIVNRVAGSAQPQLSGGSEAVRGLGVGSQGEGPFPGSWGLSPPGSPLPGPIPPPRHPLCPEYWGDLEAQRGTWK